MQERLSSSGNRAEYINHDTEIALPEFPGLHVGVDEVARVVAQITVEQPDYTTFCRADIANALEMNPSAVSKATRALADGGFLEELPAYPDPERANRPIRPLIATPKLIEYATHVPSWREKVDFFRIKKQLGLSESETSTYLIQLGMSALFENTDN